MLCAWKMIRLPKQLLRGELINGKRPPHKHKKQYQDCVKNNLKCLEMDVAKWEKVAKNREGWRHMVKEGCNTTFEKQRFKHADLNHAVRKDNVINLPDEMNS